MKREPKTRGIIWNYSSFSEKKDYPKMEYTILWIYDIFKGRVEEFFFHDFIPLANKPNILGKCVEFYERKFKFLGWRNIEQKIVRISPTNEREDDTWKIRKPLSQVDKEINHYLENRV